MCVCMCVLIIDILTIIGKDLWFVLSVHCPRYSVFTESGYY